MGPWKRNQWLNGLIRWVPLLPMVRIDYVWHTQHLRSLESWVGQDAGSDHMPVMAVMRFEEDDAAAPAAWIAVQKEIEMKERNLFSIVVPGLALALILASCAPSAGTDRPGGQCHPYRDAARTDVDTHRHRNEHRTAQPRPANTDSDSHRLTNTLSPAHRPLATRC